MTKAEYELLYGKPSKTTTVTGGFSPHKQAVGVALNQGKPVPQDVLADYPDLQPKPAIHEHKEIHPEDKINAITREDAGHMIAAGNPAVIKHIQEGVDINGQAAMQDAIRNQEMIEIAKAHKGPEREAVKQRIREIEPEINAALKGEVKVKEPWMMTREEWVDKIITEDFPGQLSSPKGDRTRQAIENTYRKAHGLSVEKAFSEGKPVPPEVLKDYPELMPSGTETPTEPTQNIQDFGEKIGGARKDTATPLGSRQKTTKPIEETPAWRKRFVAMQKVKEPDKWVIVDTKTNTTAKDGYKEKIFQSQKEAETAVPLYAVAHNHSVYQDRDNRDKYSIYRKIGDKKLIKVVNQQFGSRDDAMNYMAEHAEDILSVKTSFGEEILPKPEMVQRKGIERRTGPATAKNFTDTFGFRGVEFGNWNNQEERQEVMNYAYDGLLDLADVLNIPPKALSLNGDLAIAFGARGQGLSGAKAHYERDYGVINLTKMSGAGSLAHEWFHALDHYFGRLDTKASSEKIQNKRGDLVYKAKGAGDYLSHGISKLSGARPEIQEAYKNLIDTMYTKAEQYIEDTEKAEKFVSTARNNLKAKLDSIRTGLKSDLSKTYTYRKNLKGLLPATEQQLTEFDRLAEHLVQGNDLKTQHRTIRPKGLPENKPYLGGRYTNDTLEAINAILKAVRNRSGFNAEQTGTLDPLRRDMNLYETRLKMLADAHGKTEKIKNIPTSFAIEAKKIDQGRASNYWSEPHEMAARAFASYAEDRIVEQGGQSDFLVYQAHGGVFVPMIDGFVARPYPEGDERVVINKAFDRFVEALKTKETDKGVAIYEQGAGYNKSAPTFYSQMQRVLSDKLPNKGPASAFREMIRVWANKGEFKQEEHKWSGIDEWLSERKGTVTKQEVIGWLKKQSVLHEGQALFENKAEYGKGLISKPDMEVIGITGKEIIDSNKEWLFRPALRKYAKQYLGQEYLNKDTGWNLRVSKDGYGKITGGPGLTIDDMRAVAALPQLIENAVLAESHPDKGSKQEIKAIHRFYAPLGIGERLFRVKLTVKEYKDTRIDKKFYSLDTIEIESSAVNAHAPYKEDIQAHERPAGLPLKISIAELLKNATKNDGGKFYETPTRSEVKEVQEAAYADARKQLDLFKDGHSLSGKTIPGTQRGLGNRGRGDSGIKTIGVGIRRDLVRKGYVDLRGQTADTANTLAEIAQVFRSPQFETFRIFYVKDGKIAGQEGVSSRMPGGSSVFLRGNISKHLFNILNRAQRLKADSFYFLHNHPSGDPSPSPEDRDVTVRIIERLRKLSSKSRIKVPQFKGHVIINSGKYAVIELSSSKFDPSRPPSIDVEANIYNLPDFKSDELLTAETTNEYLLASINGPKDVVKIGQALKQPDNFVTIIYRGSKAVIRAIEAMPINQFKSEDAPGILRNRAKDYGARDVLTYYNGLVSSGYESRAVELIREGVLLDAISDKASVLPFQVATPRADRWMGQKVTDTVVRVAEEAERYGNQGLLPKQIIDRLFRLPFKAVGKIDADGRLHIGVAVYRWLSEAITKKKSGNETIDNFAEFVRRGLVDKYGLPENYQQYKHLKMLEQNAISAEGLEYYHEIYKAINDEGQRQAIYRILTEDVEPGEWESLTEPVRNAIIRHGEEMVDADMLSRETFERNRGTYLHRTYARHEAEKPAIQRAIKKIRFIGKELKHRGLKKTVSPNEVEKWINGDKDGNTWKQMGIVDRSYYEGKTLVKKGSAIIWRDWTKEERQRMGEIEDPAYAIAVSFDLIAKDLSTGKMYKRIAEDPLLSADDNPGGWVYFGKEKIINSGTHKWGALANKWVHPDVARDLLLTEKYSQPSTWRWLLTQWKLNKTGRNPVVHTNNIVSNFFLQDMHDVGMSDFASGIKSIYEGDVYYDEAKKAGVFGYNLIQSEIKRHYNPAMTKLIYKGDILKTIVEIARHPIRTIGAIDKKFIGLYSKEDDVFRMALYRKLRLQGKTIEDAAAEARRQFIDYDISAPWIQWAKNSIFPFISYPYRAVPLIAEVALTRPWKLLKYFVLFAGIEALTEFLLGVDADEERKLLPEEQQGRTWFGVHKQIRTIPGFFDISRKIPGADIVGLSEKSALPMPNMAVPGGPIISGLALLLNTDPFTLKHIRTDNAPVSEQSKAVSLWIYRQLGPNAPWVPASYSWDKISKAYRGVTDELGRPLDLETAIPSTLGFKVSRFDPELLRIRKHRELMKEYDDARSVVRQAEWRFRKGEIKLNQFNRIRSEQLAIMRPIKEKLGEINDTARKLQKQSGVYAPGP